MNLPLAKDSLESLSLLVFFFFFFSSDLLKVNSIPSLKDFFFFFLQRYFSYRNFSLGQIFHPHFVSALRPDMVVT